MSVHRNLLVQFAALSLLGAPVLAAENEAALATTGAARSDDPLAPWRNGVRISRISDQPQHSIHSYYVTTPESPDGKWLVYYASVAKSGHEGELHVLERATGKTVVLCRGVMVEDAHRVACQQWSSGGRRIVFHNVLGDGRWAICSVDRDGSSERILAIGRQIGFSPAAGNWVPLYGPHWAPGEHTDLELLNVETAEIVRTPLTAESVATRYPEWTPRRFGDRPISIFFPVLSPDLRRVFVKIATPAGGDFRSSKASERYGLVCYDLRESKFCFLQEDWGHPAWSGDSKLTLNTGGRITNAATGKTRRIPDLPQLPGSHPSFSPDGRLFTSNSRGEAFGGEKGSWIVGVGDVRTGEFIVLYAFDNHLGATSWRVSHPHPVFSPDGQRIYFNVSADEWTRLHVAEAAP